MSCALHDSFAFEVISWSYDLTAPVQLSIVRCPRRGTMRFIPSEVWRQKLHALHSYAFIKVINCRCWWSEVIIQPSVVVRKEMVFWYIGIIEFYIWNISLVNWSSLKLLINSTCALNSLSKQFACWDVSSHPCITQCRYLMFVQREWEVAAHSHFIFWSHLSDNW